MPMGVWSRISSYFRELLGSCWSIVESSVVATPYLLSAGEHHKEVTEQYPDPISARMPEDLPARTRGFLKNDINRCTGCGDCARVCPARCISLVNEPGPDPSKIWVSAFDIDHSRCVFCGLCVEVCNPGSLTHSREYAGAQTLLEGMTASFGRGKITPEQRDKWAEARSLRGQD